MKRVLSACAVSRARIVASHGSPAQHLPRAPPAAMGAMLSRRSVPAVDAGAAEQPAASARGQKRSAAETDAENQTPPAAKRAAATSAAAPDGGAVAAAGTPAQEAPLSDGAAEAEEAEEPQADTPAELSYDAAVAGGGAALRSALAHHGYALVRGVVPEAEAHARWRGEVKALLARVVLGDAAVEADEGGAVASLFDDAAAVADAARWPLGGCPGVFDGYGAGQIRACWEARLHPRVRALFAALWATRRLVSSVDGVCAERPRGAAEDRPPPLTLHTDQNPFGPAGGGPGMLAAQGVLSLTPTDAHTGGTTLVAGSHRLHRAMLTEVFPNAALRADPSLNWRVCRPCVLSQLRCYLTLIQRCLLSGYLLAPEEQAWLLAQPGCALLHVATAPGDLLLWDSRTVHCGRRAAGAAPHDAWRLALYICMWPACRLDAGARAAKAAALGVDAEGKRIAGARAESTSHWPDGRELKPRYGWPADVAVDAWAQPRPASARSDGVTAAPAIALTSDALRLAGVLPYDDDDESERAAVAAVDAALARTLTGVMAHVGGSAVVNAWPAASAPPAPAEHALDDAAREHLRIMQAAAANGTQLYMRDVARQRLGEPAPSQPGAGFGDDTALAFMRENVQHYPVFAIMLAAEDAAIAAVAAAGAAAVTVATAAAAERMVDDDDDVAEASA